ncbi:MAG: 30S ribosomal protein S17 [Kiritimatiellaeota bacterium]|nr:30S ribosomal protein S17 [Kiritimatiellota bacterium]
MTEEHEKTKKSLRKTRVGVVESDCQDKTLVVRVDRRAAHPKYRKVITHSKRYHVHDEHNEARVGDRVEIVETRPLSRLKRWRLGAILQRRAT